MNASDISSWILCRQEIPAEEIPELSWSAWKGNLPWRLVEQGEEPPLLVLCLVLIWI